MLIVIGGLSWANSNDSEPGGEQPSAQPVDDASTPVTSASGSPRADTARPEASPAAITLQAGATTVPLLEPAKLTGSYPASPSATLHVQILDSGSWVDYPLPTVVNDAGQFTTYVEIGQRGVNQLRVIEPSSGKTSNVVTVTVQ